MNRLKPFKNWAVLPVILMLTMPSQAQESQKSLQLQEGRSLFVSGLSKDGTPTVAISQGQPLAGELFACVNCHRHSGLGTSEGGYQIPDITGPTLFAPIEVRQKELYAVRTEGFYTRPAYTRETLRKAITEGIGASGRPLSKIMPRYLFNQSQTDALIDYINSLDYSQPPGVGTENLQLATIITENTEPAKKQAFLTTFHQFFKEKNAQTRHEVRRVKYSPWHKNWQYDNYRKWKLNVWELKGDPSTWFDQLKQYYDSNPVFAVVGGSSEESWQPIDHFCEAQQLPCLFPDTDLPVQKPGHYSLYFSAGMNLETRRVIHYLKQNPQFTNIIQLVGEDFRSQFAANDITKRTAALKHPINATSISLAGSLKGTLRIPENDANTLYLLWLTNDELQNLPVDFAHSKSPLLLSSTLLQRQFDQIPEHIKHQSWLIHPFSLPSEPSHNVRSRAWLNARGIKTPYLKLQSNTYLSLSILTEAMMHIRSNFSQDYLIERIEHMLENSPETSVYPRLSLAPGQRFAAKGSYLIPLEKINSSSVQARSYWAVPEH
ncbi:hypothetical protein [Amphritea sp.]|uniref:hypothetical protein n=1 Tax=Amphritea sp. TaxID=1872502 RepID=UPI0025BAEA49|nr:hypothetical protein [Amphritea sp.]